jgi:hypothetical protein
MEKILFFIALVFTMLLVNGCMGDIPIEEIRENPNQYMGQEITVSGTVDRTTKIFDFIGFTLQDDTEENSIFVKLSAGSVLPAEDSRVRVKGTIQESVLGHYIYATEVVEL